MSSAGWIFVGLLFISPFYEAAQIKDEPSVRKSRQRRSLVDLKDMVKSVTGREGSDFINYGNWCGLGGSGKPVDPVDECCQNHDICYDLATSGVCREHGTKGVYQLEYKWRVTDDGMAVCNDEKDECKMAICFCDAIISKCLKSNIDAYDPKNYHDIDLFQLFKEADYLSS
uniref:Phospholipase A2 n=1 Tax=Cupiennius salei TaxID=6928 RepID=A0A4Y5UGI5_CUPSA|nr:phospholipase A2 [Cupiennius salei]